MAKGRVKWVISGLFVLLLAFLSLSYLHAYAFTHPTSNPAFKIEREGMHLTFPNLLKATFLGIRPIRHIADKNPGEVGLSYENVTFTSTDNLMLKGWFIPSAKQKGTIVLVHGYNGNRGSLDMADYFHRAGYAILLFDFRGHGESEGDLISFGYYESRDVIGAVNYLKQRGDVDMSRVYGLGQSMGSVALVYAERQQPSFRGLVLESLFTDFYENSARRFESVYGFPKFPFATSVTFFGGIILHIDGFSFSPLNEISEINTPVYLIHDALDETIRTEDAQKLFDSANEPKELWISQAEHANAYDAQREEYQKKILLFLKENKD
ncbi:MAG: alpha/beta fold hydrolase [Nanoarchaeota archaeon]|nr:alpha/beta fold hydrolase [Nanoarchaeota archaeon]